MSMKVMARVWEYSNAAAGTLLVLLAIADRANDEGEASPVVHSLALKSRLSERQVQRALSALQKMGELIILRAGGRGPKDTNNYIVKVDDKLTSIRDPSVYRPYVPPSVDNLPRTQTNREKIPPIGIFSLSADRKTYAMQVGVVDPGVQFEKFRLHHEARGNRMASWDKAWQLWCRNAVEFAKSRGNAAAAPDPLGRYPKGEELWQRTRRT